MTKKLLLAPALLLLLVLSHAAQAQVCQRHREAAGGFSICLPEGWTVEETQGQKFKYLFGPRGQTFTPNMNFKVEATSSALSAYAAASKTLILSSADKIGATSIKFVDQANFTTDGGAAGIRLSFSTVFKGLVIRTVQYYYNGKPGEKLIITSTALEADRETMDKIFDRAAKTFQLDR